MFKNQMAHIIHNGIYGYKSLFKKIKIFFAMCPFIITDIIKLKKTKNINNKTNKWPDTPIDNLLFKTPSVANNYEERLLIASEKTAKAIVEIRNLIAGILIFTAGFIILCLINYLLPRL